jgi:hypothetical protein
MKIVLSAINKFYTFDLEVEPKLKAEILSKALQTSKAFEVGMITGMKHWDLIGR